MRYRKRNSRFCNGFTFVELMVALMVTGILFTAVTTLAFAMGKANDATDDTAGKQAQLRYTTLRINELIKHCKLVCRTSSTELAIWRADENGDGLINPTELIYIETGQGRNFIRLLEFPSSGVSDDTAIDVSTIRSGMAQNEVMSVATAEYTVLIPQCTNVAFVVDRAALRTRSIHISFSQTENEIVRTYEIHTALRCNSEYLLDNDGNFVGFDDDQGFI